MASFVYITAADRNEALSIGRALVAERLAACVNILDGMTSLYWWNDKMEQGQEAVLIAKTNDELVGRLTQRVRELHSYDCPCVVSWPIAQGNADYLRWIEAEASPSEDGAAG